jgi:hypothetical protein
MPGLFRRSPQPQVRRPVILAEPPAPPALDATRFYAETDAAGVTDPTLDIPSVTWLTGDKVYVTASGKDDDAVVTSVTAAGLTFSQLRAQDEVTQQQVWIEVWESDNAASGDTQTVTVTLDANPHVGGMMAEAWVVHGASADPETDADNGAETGASDTTTPSVDVTTVADVTLLIYAFQHRNPATVTFDGADGLTESQNNNQIGTAGNIAGYSSGYKLVSSQGTYNGSLTLDAARDWVAIGWSVKEGGGGTLVQVTAADSLGFSDAPVRVGTFLRTMADSLALGNTVARMGTFLRSNADGLTIAATVTRLLTLARTAADTLSLGNTVARIGTFGRTLADTLTIADVVTRTGTFLRSAADSVSFADAVAASKIFARTLADSLSFSDSVTRTGAFLRTAADSLGFSDAVARLGTVARTASDALGIGDAVNRTGTFLRSAADALSFADVVNAIVSSPANIVRSLADTVSIMDNAVRTGAFGRTASDALGFAESVVAAIAVGVTGGLAPIGRAVSWAVSGVAGHLRPGGGAHSDTPGGKAEHPKPKD